MLIRALMACFDAVFEIFHSVFLVPMVDLPQRIWRQALGPFPRMRALPRTLWPHILVLLGIAAWRFTAWGAGRPEVIPRTISGDGRVRIALWLSSMEQMVVASAQAWMSYGKVWLASLHGSIPWAASLLVGMTLWLAVACVCTLFLGPVYLLFWDPGSRAMLLRPVQPVLKGLRHRLVGFWRGRARQHKQWFVGADGTSPMFADIGRATWILGGTDRRSGSIPWLTRVRAHVLAGHPLILVDTVGSVTTSQELQSFVQEAGRAGMFRQVTAPVEPEYFLSAYKRGAVIYIGLSLHTNDAGHLDTARQFLTSLQTASTQVELGDKPWVLALQDISELPLNTTVLDSPSFLHLCVAGKVDRDVAAQVAKHGPAMILALVGRSSLETQLIARLCKNDAVLALKAQQGLLWQRGRAERWISQLDRPRY